MVGLDASGKTSILYRLQVRFAVPSCLEEQMARAAGSPEAQCRLQVQQLLSSTPAGWRDPRRMERCLADEVEGSLLVPVRAL